MKTRLSVVLLILCLTLVFPAVAENMYVNLDEPAIRTLTLVKDEDPVPVYTGLLFKDGTRITFSADDVATHESEKPTKVKKATLVFPADGELLPEFITVMQSGNLMVNGYLVLVPAVQQDKVYLPSADGQITLVRGKIDTSEIKYEKLPKGVYAVLGQLFEILTMDKVMLQRLVIVNSDKEPFYYLIEVK